MRILIFCLAVSCWGTSQKIDARKRQITEAETRAVVQAVQDEIYDYGFEGDYDRAGENAAGTSSKWISRMRIYIAPETENGGGEIIYDLKHDGEVYRLFTIRKDGLAILDGDPQLGFPPTQRSRKTQYMDSAEVRQLKRNWLERHYDVDTSPSMSVVRDSAHRQKLRTGFSYWETEVLPNLKAAQAH